MVLNEQLSNMYQPDFNELIAHLKSDGLVDKVQPPFLLGLNREKEGKVSIGDETWYTQADLKVRFSERKYTNGDGQNLKTEHNSVRMIW